MENPKTNPLVIERISFKTLDLYVLNAYNITKG